ncbi:MerR family transcriptional regulator [Calditerricola satsumensis]|uniref:HTH-type transcriptional regulator GlnR n=1 Tax=Calditerricola satsumensis TaxID=373054 RepID=A0A8J3BCZ5_9BACI|nr:MerR family transcriptional regulator [Calditerricola satsumensis]GGJ95459.1 HTH-type transcriptional regulator GlnR [Calditerricola satsumensis]
MADDIRRNMPLFPIGIVMKLTGLSARQIRYYEQHELVKPARTKGNQRLFSLNDIDRLLEIKSLIEQGVNIAGIKKMLAMKEAGKPSPEAATEPKAEPKRKELTEKELHELLKQQVLLHRPGQAATLIQGELSRFFH